MVKLFGYELKLVREAILREGKTQAVSADHARGLFASTGIDHYRPKDVQSLYDAYNDRDLIRGPIDDLVESALNGYYTTVESEGNKAAKQLVDDFGKHFNLDDLLVNVGKNSLIAGFNPVDTRIDLSGEPQKSALKIIHPTTVDEVLTNGEEPPTVTRLIQKKMDGGKITIDGAFIAQFIYGRIGNNILGTSYIRGVINVLNTLDAATTNVDSILDRYIAPIGIWKTMGDTEPIKASVTAREPGEDIYLGHLSQQEIETKDGIVQFMTIDPRVPFWEYIEYLVKYEPSPSIVVSPAFTIGPSCTGSRSGFSDAKFSLGTSGPSPAFKTRGSNQAFSTVRLIVRWRPWTWRCTILSRTSADATVASLLYQRLLLLM